MSVTDKLKTLINNHRVKIKIRHYHFRVKVKVNHHLDKIKILTRIRVRDWVIHLWTVIATPATAVLRTVRTISNNSNTTAPTTIISAIAQTILMRMSPGVTMEYKMKITIRMEAVRVTAMAVVEYRAPRGTLSLAATRTAGRTVAAVAGTTAKSGLPSLRIRAVLHGTPKAPTSHQYKSLV